MSKLMGKIILKSKEFEGKTLFVRYLKTKKCFEFKGFRITKAEEEKDLIESCGLTFKEIGENWLKDRLVVNEDVLSIMILTDKMENIVSRWSIGYKTVEKLGDRVGDQKELEKREMGFIKESLSKEAVMDFDIGTYQDLCVWQYLFNISETILNKVRKAWKRKKWGRNDNVWIELKKRENNVGRKLGSKNKKNADTEIVDGETLEEFEERIKYNKECALKKGIVFWFLDACQEECKRKKIKYDKEKCLKEWKECRKMLVKE